MISLMILAIVGNLIRKEDALEVCAEGNKLSSLHTPGIIIENALLKSQDSFVRYAIYSLNGAILKIEDLRDVRLIHDAVAVQTAAVSEANAGQRALDWVCSFYNLLR